MPLSSPWPSRRVSLAALALSLGTSLALVGCEDEVPMDLGGEAPATRVKDYSFAEKKAFSATDGQISAIAWHPKRPWIALGGGDGKVKVLDLPGKREVVMRGGHDEWVTEVAWSAGGRYLVTTSTDNTVLIWDVTTRRRVKKLDGHNGDVKALAVSDDLTRVASGSVDRNVVVWNTKDGSEIARYYYPNSVYTLQFLPDDPSLLLVGGRNATIDVWDYVSDQRAERVDAPRDSVFDMQFLGDSSNFVTVGADGRLLVVSGSDWSVTEISEHEYMVDGLAVHPEGKLVAVGDRGGEVTLWNVETKENLNSAHVDKESVRALAFSPDGRQLAAVGEAAGLIFLETESLMEEKRETGFSGFTSTMQEAALSKGGGVACGRGGTGVLCWDAATDEELGRIAAKGDDFEAIAVSPDGQLVAISTGSGKIRVHMTKDGAERKTLEFPEGVADALAFGADGQTLIAGGGWGALISLSVESGARGVPFGGHESRIYAVTVSADGSKVFSSGRDEKVSCWDAQTGKMLWSIYGFHVDALAASPDGKLLAIGDREGLIRTYDIATGKKAGELKGHSGRILGLGFHSDSDYLLSAGRDKTLKLWSVPNASIISSTLPHSGRLSALAMSPDGTVAATAGRGGAGNLILFELVTGATSADAEGAAAAAETDESPGLSLAAIEGVPTDPELPREKTDEERAAELVAEIRSLAEGGKKDMACDRTLGLHRYADNIDPYRREVTAICQAAAEQFANPDKHGRCVKFAEIALEFSPGAKAITKLGKRCQLMGLQHELDTMNDLFAKAPTVEASLRHYNWRGLMAGGEQVERTINRHDPNLELEGSKELMATGMAYSALGHYMLAAYEGEERALLMNRGKVMMTNAERMAPDSPRVSELAWALTKERYMTIWIFAGAVGGLLLVVIVIMMAMKKRQAARMKALGLGPDDEADAPGDDGQGNKDGPRVGEAA